MEAIDPFAYEYSEDTKPELSLKLFEQLHYLSEQQSFSRRLTKSHVGWILRYLRFLNTENINTSTQVSSQEQLKSEAKHSVETFLGRLATESHCEAAVQTQAEQAITFYYQHFLKTTLGDLHFPRRKQRRGFFSRFGETHCAAVLCKMSGASQLMAKLAVATHLKLREVINLRVTDVNLKKNTLIVRNADDSIKFTINIPVQLVLDLRIQIMKVNHLVNQHNEQYGDDFEDAAFDKNSAIQTQAQYLFPYRFNPALQSFHIDTNLSEKHMHSFKQTPLTILKNDIRIAIHGYLRFFVKPNDAIHLPLQKPSVRQIVHEKRLLARRNHPAFQQRSFNFPNELGAA